MRSRSFRITLFLTALSFSAQSFAESPAPAPTPNPAAAQPALFPDGLPVFLSSTPEGLASLSAQSCNACHYQAHASWSASKHAGTGSPAFWAAVKAVQEPTACTSCHLPLAAQHRTLTQGYVDGDLSRPDQAPNLAWDPILETEGVTCAACHVRGGVVLTSRAKPASSTNAPHPIETSNHLGTSEFCANCHQASAEGGALPLYDTYGEWKASRYADAGVGCIDCHGGTQTLGAPADPHAITADPARALTIGLKLSEPVVSRGTPLSFVVTLQNTGAGHAFPTGSPFKTLRLEVSVLDEKGSLLADPFTAPLGRTLVESPTPRIAEDHRILPGETRRYEGKFTVSQRARAGNGQFRIAIVQDGREQALIERAMPITIE